jgi:hypothetical protein
MGIGCHVPNPLAISTGQPRRRTPSTSLCVLGYLWARLSLSTVMTGSHTPTAIPAAAPLPAFPEPLRLRLRLPYPWTYCGCSDVALPSPVAAPPNLRAGLARPVAAPYSRAAFALTIRAPSRSSRRVPLRLLNISYYLPLVPSVPVRNTRRARVQRVYSYTYYDPLPCRAHASSIPDLST